MEKILIDLWQSPKTGLTSAVKFYNSVKKLHPKVTLKIVKDFISNQEAAQLTKEIKKPKFNHIVAPEINDQWQMDLLDLTKYKKVNKGYGWLLVVIDIFSRYGWAIPIKNKSAENVEEVLVDLLAKYANHSGHKLNHIRSDNGSEFISKKSQALFKKYEIKHWLSEPYTHNTTGIVERFNRTIRTVLRRYWAMYDTKSWYPIIDDVIANYNNTRHSTIKTTPYAVYNGEDYARPQKQPHVQVFKKGDMVRRKLVKNIFDKPTLRWSKTVYTIHKANPRSYELYNPDTDSVLQGVVKPNELQKIEKVNVAEHKIADSHIAEKHIKVKKLEDEWKQLGNDPKNIIDTKRIKKKNSKYADYV